MAYTRVNWENLPSTNTPLNATNLNKMDAGIASLYPTAWTNATLSSGISGGVKYLKFGNLVLVEIRELYSSSEITASGTIIASGLPSASVPTNFVVSLVTGSTSNDSNCRLRIDNSGNLTLFNDKMYAGSSSLQYYGQVMYLSN